MYYTKIFRWWVHEPGDRRRHPAEGPAGEHQEKAMECSVLGLGGGECKEDAPHQETADAIDPIVPLLQRVTRLPR